jgi:DNA-3-methyladenine glycosylase II
VRKGAQLLDKLEEMPKPKELVVRGERWGPYRTLAGLYLWRICDAVQADAVAKAGPKVKRSQD